MRAADISPAARAAAPPMMAMERAAAYTKIEPGEQKLQVNLSMTFELQ